MIVAIHADDTRGIPPGRRYVELVDCGRKWVRVRLPGQVRCKRLPRSTFDRIVIEPKEE